MRHVTSGLLLATAGLALAAPASAATVVYQGTCQQLCQLQQVNGTVNSVSYFYEFTGSQRFAPVGLASDGPTVYSASGTLRVSGAKPVDYSYLVNGYDTGVGIAFYYDFPINQTLTGDLSYYQGTGTFEIGATSFPTLTYVSGRGVNLSQQLGGSPGDSPYRIVIDYDVAPFVPEPSTWALMLAGFGMVGFAMRRRKVAFA
ncbi:PEPxxWA-CTERM sorting domain-containing protein [Sphingomonas abaci]|uniref:Ice-binding protein C-terminal domain-containing protein n=1 Tax=Sphingomonas abaci TaxID=237611 RepID=A0A7W7AMQ3_9SPHN|nr:PEPxxWA-CTERM sorting domain-containing protein [Sphingomonas abaci]MBB4619913.1 hypothetical protein [Sphingomonas abaci]